MSPHKLLFVAAGSLVCYVTVNSQIKFLVHQVFADHESSKYPIPVARESIWNLRRRVLYCGTSVHAIFRGRKYIVACYILLLSDYVLSRLDFINTDITHNIKSGLTTEEIQYCFWRGMGHLFCIYKAERKCC